MNNLTLIFPGSFDPITNGHIDIAVRGAKIAKRLIVAIAENQNKQSTFSIDMRVQFAKNALKSYSNIEIDCFSGLLADYAAQKCAAAILRGVRSGIDLTHEQPYATYNALLSGGIETIFLTATPARSFISSSTVREAALHKYRSGYQTSALDDMIPHEVAHALAERYKIEVI